MSAKAEFAKQASLAAFEAIVAQQVRRFPKSGLLRRLDSAELTIGHYHAILRTLFHQTYNSPYSFARAAVNCGWWHEGAKEYLLRHAEAERMRWRWVLDDLQSTGYRGPNPRDEPPHYTAQAYIGLNCYVAERIPIACLATAAVLEGIGAAHGGAFGPKLATLLNLEPSQAKYFLSRAPSDVVHVAQLREAIAKCELTATEWQWMSHVAICAGRFYRAMYDHEAFA